MPTNTERYLIDNSAWSRLSTSEQVAEAFRAVVDSARPVNILICPPTAAEIGFSARSGNEHDQMMAGLAAFPECRAAPSKEDVLDIQNRLWNGGLLRAVGPMGTLIAAYAIANDAVVLHYDRDFEHVGSVVERFAHRWIVPPGTIS
jgi:predicted nucleic acid-binding protein